MKSFVYHFLTLSAYVGRDVRVCREWSSPW
ncbi:hypothetical protein LMG24076_02851 [Trinickia soli]|nr:hypothetical protein LMG24076_02851 [Trinickia soli]